MFDMFLSRTVKLIHDVKAWSKLHSKINFSLPDIITFHFILFYSSHINLPQPASGYGMSSMLWHNLFSVGLKISHASPTANIEGVITAVNSDIF